MQLIDGKKISDEIKNEIIVETKKFIKENSRKPHLVAVLVGEDGGSVTYVQNKIKDCEEVGFKSTIIKFDTKVTQKELLKTVFKLNNDTEVDGFIVQLPLPSHISEDEIIDAIDPVKDVDGFNPVNLGRMMAGLPSYTSATPMGIVELLKRYKIETVGKHCVIIGRSNIVGRPLSVLLSQKGIDCTVTVCHSKTKNLKDITKQADIIVAALGKHEFLTAEMVKEGAVVIDVGTTRVKSDETKSGWKLTGDVKFDEVSKKCSFITPVPGGVGPMTRVALLKNTLLAANGTIY